MANLPLQNISVTSSPEGENSYMPALISLGVLYFMMGFVTCLNDTLVPFFKTGFDLTYAQSSLVQFCFFLTYGLMSIPAGRVVGKIGYKHGMVGGFLIAGIGAILFYPASVYNEYHLFLGALFVIALGLVLLQVSANPYVTVLGPSRTAASRLATIQGIGSLGTVVAPVFGTMTILSAFGTGEISSDMLQVPYLFIGGVLLLIALGVSLLNLPAIEAPEDEASQEKNSGGLFAFRNLRWGTVALFAYVGAEVAVGSFLINYALDVAGIETIEASYYLALYGGCMFIGRFVGAAVLRSVRPPVVLSVVSATAALLILASVISTGHFAVVTMAAVGLCNSVMFAVIFSLSVDGLGRRTGKASGILSTAIVGGAIIPYAQGYVKDVFLDWQIAFAIPLLCYIAILRYGLSGYKRHADNQEKIV